eukprot:g4533.t1
MRFENLSSTKFLEFLASATPRMPGIYNIPNFLKNMAVLGIIGLGGTLIPLAHAPVALVGGDHAKIKLAHANATLKRVHNNGDGRKHPFDSLFPSFQPDPKRVFVPASSYFDAIWNWKTLAGFESGMGYHRAAETGGKAAAKKPSGPYDGMRPLEMVRAFEAKHPEGGSDAERRAVVASIVEFLDGIGSSR